MGSSPFFSAPRLSSTFLFVLYPTCKPVLNRLRLTSFDSRLDRLTINHLPYTWIVYNSIMFSSNQLNAFASCARIWKKNGLRLQNSATSLGSFCLMFFPFELKKSTPFEKYYCHIKLANLISSLKNICTSSVWIFQGCLMYMYISIAKFSLDNGLTSGKLLSKSDRKEQY